MLSDLGDVCRSESCCPKGSTVAHAQANHPVAAKAGNKRKAKKKV